MRRDDRSRKATGIFGAATPGMRREFGVEHLSTATERRQTLRAKPNGLVYLSLSAENGGIVIDASEGGLQFQAVAPVEASDTPLKVWFTLNSSSRIEAVGEIVWTDQSKRLGGLQFTSLAAPARLSIRKWLEQSAAMAAHDESEEADSREDEESEAIRPEAWASPLEELDDDVTSPFPSEKTLQARENANGRGNGAAGVLPAPTPPPARPAPGPFIVASAPSVSAVPAAPAAPAAREYAPEIESAAIVPEAPAAPLKPAPPKAVPPMPSIVDGRSESNRAILESLAGGASAPPIRETIRADEALPSSSWRATERPAKAEELLARDRPYEGSTIDSPYSGREHDSILSEVQKAAQHRIDEAARYGSHVGISVRSSDFEGPWRPSMMTRTASPDREKTSRLAGFLSRAGVSREMVRTLEIMILVVAFVGIAALGAFLFRRQIGGGVQWIGREVSNQNSAAISDQSGSEPSPVDLDISPLLKPPPGVQSAVRAAAVKPRLKLKPAATATQTTGGGTPGAASASAGVGTANTDAGGPTGPDDSGDAALATGLQYLREDGGPTVTNVAVKWLWASVEKGNTKAAIILADLYVWGRGVPQNCEQARVLLIAASKRGSAEAAQRLQDMESDGCSNAKPTSN
jgi:hypothetical protein